MFFFRDKVPNGGPNCITLPRTVLLVVAGLLALLLSHPATIDCQTQTTSSSTRPSSNSPQTVLYVAPWSESFAKEEFTEDERNVGPGACRSPQTACASLSDALAIASIIRSRNAARSPELDSKSPDPEPADPELAEVGTNTIVIYLMTNQSSRCRVSMGSNNASSAVAAHPQAQSTSWKLNKPLELTKLVLDGSNLADGCERAILVPPAIAKAEPDKERTDQEEGFLFVLERSFAVVFRRIELNEEESLLASAANRPLAFILLEDCKQVAFVECAFRSTFASQQNIVIKNSFFVQFISSVFEGQGPSQLEPVCLAPGIQTSVVFANYSQGQNLQHIPTDDDERVSQEWIDQVTLALPDVDFSIGNLNSQGQWFEQHHTRSTWGTAASVIASHLLFFQCNFSRIEPYRYQLNEEGIGAFEHGPQAEYGSVLWVLMAYANTGQSLQPSALIQSCLFADNIAPMGAVYIHLSADRVKPPSKLDRSNTGGARRPACPLCNVTDILSLAIINTDFVNNSAYRGGALHIDIESAESSVNGSEELLIADCVFERNTATVWGGAVAIHTDQSLVHPGTRLDMRNVMFSENTARNGAALKLGGALLIAGTWRGFAGNHGNRSLLHLHDATFLSNSGLGIVLVKSSRVHFSGKSVFVGNKKSAIVSVAAKIVFHGSVHAVCNYGTNGGVFLVLEKSSQIDLWQVSDFLVLNNSAVKKGAVAYVGIAACSTSILPRNANATCPLVLPENFLRNETQQKDFLEKNGRGSLGQQLTTVLFMASLYPCMKEFWALSTIFFRVQDPRYCMPYGPSHWELHAECDVRKDPLYCAVADQFSSDGSCHESCALLLNASLPKRVSCDYSITTLVSVDQSADPRGYYTMKPNTGPVRQVTAAATDVLMPNATAITDGPQWHDNDGSALSRCQAELRDFQRRLPCRTRHGPSAMNEPVPERRVNSNYAPRGLCSDFQEKCNVSNAFLYQPDQLCYSYNQGLLVRNERIDEHHMSMRDSIDTMPTWLVFRQATTSCYKQIGDDIWYFHTKCHFSEIYERVLNSSTPLPVATDCILLELAEKYQLSNGIPLLPVLPGYKFVIVPWASAILSWSTSPQQSNNSHCRWDEAGRFKKSAQHSISNITLNPAPGEYFDLYISAFGEMLNRLDVPLLVRVEYESKDVLLGTPQHIYQSTKNALLWSGSAEKNLVLYGPPGAHGYLEVTIQALSTYGSAQSKPIELKIPFRLRDCHLGYRWSTANSSQAQEWVREFNVHVHKDSEANFTELQKLTMERLSCKCRNDEYTCNIACREGKHISVSSYCWAGRNDSTTIPGKPFNSSALDGIGGGFVISETEFLGNGSDPLGRLDQSPFPDPFVVSFCDKGTCSKHPGKDTWLLWEDDPCTAESNARGLLCSQCKPDYSVNLDRVGCSDCRKHTMPLSIAVVCVLLFVLAVIIFLLALTINIGVTAILDTWLFSVLILYCIFGSNETVATMYIGIITFGLSNICLSNHLTQLQRQMAMLASPFMTVVCIIAFLILSRTRHGRTLRFLQRLQHRNSIRHVLWLVNLWYITLFTYSSAVLMYCIPIGGRSRDGKRVVYIDATVTCFSKEHALYVAAAMISVVCFVLPVPILLVWQPTHRWPALIGLLDEAKHIYEPSCQWWATYNIMRRLAYSILMAIVTGGPHKRAAILVMLVFELALHGYVRPFRRTATLWKLKNSDNVIMFVMLFILCISCGLEIARREHMVSPHLFGPSYVLPVSLFGTVTLILLALYLHCFITSWWHTLSKQPRQCLRSLWTDDDDDGGDSPQVEPDSETFIGAEQGYQRAGISSIATTADSTPHNQSHQCAASPRAIAGSAIAGNAAACRLHSPHQGHEVPVRQRTSQWGNDDTVRETKLREPLLLDHLLSASEE
ncbi:uncharacterized protein LOC135820618 [Sycon ciliatum]|uniref:uncharacterized protein LOC135820618 n=1 Tax=Sycon ciliatum TaxID=27933 RepID=UPI0031F69355